MRDFLKIWALLVIGSVIGIACLCFVHECPTDEATPEVETGTEPQTFEDLLDAIEWVESKGDADAIGDNGRAVGAYQIHHCYFEDVRWGGGNMKTLKEKDRLNKDKSREMVRRYMSRYATYYRLGHEPTLEDMARIHNGGPNGWERKSTKAYWEKVKARIEVSKP